MANQVIRLPQYPSSVSLELHRKWISMLTQSNYSTPQKAHTLVQTRQSLCSVLMKSNDDKNQQARISLTKFALFSQSMPSLFLPRGSKERQTQPISKTSCHPGSATWWQENQPERFFLLIFKNFHTICFDHILCPPSSSPLLYPPN